MKQRYPREANGGSTVTVLRWTGTCPSCGAKRSIIRKLGEQQAYCEKCGLGFDVEFLEKLSTIKSEGVTMEHWRSGKTGWLRERPVDTKID